MELTTFGTDTTSGLISLSGLIRASADFSISCVRGGGDTSFGCDEMEAGGGVVDLISTVEICLELLVSLGAGVALQVSIGAGALLVSLGAGALLFSMGAGVALLSLVAGVEPLSTRLAQDCLRGEFVTAVEAGTDIVEVGVTVVGAGVQVSHALFIGPELGFLSAPFPCDPVPPPRVPVPSLGFRGRVFRLVDPPRPEGGRRPPPLSP